VKTVGGIKLPVRCLAHVRNRLAITGHIRCALSTHGEERLHQNGDETWTERVAVYPTSAGLELSADPGGPPHDPVNRPKHYTSHPSGVECITITQHMNFCRGNAIKYIWRAGEKADEVEDLRKARFYIDKEIERLEAKRAAQ